MTYKTFLQFGYYLTYYSIDKHMAWWPWAYKEGYLGRLVLFISPLLKALKEPRHKYNGYQKSWPFRKRFQNKCKGNKIRGKNIDTMLLQRNWHYYYFLEWRSSCNCNFQHAFRFTPYQLKHWNPSEQYYILTTGQIALSCSTNTWVEWSKLGHMWVSILFTFMARDGIDHTT